MQRISALLIGVFLVFICLEDTPAQEMPAPVQGIVPKLSIVDKTDEVEPSFVINLPVAMQLANARPLDIAIAGERIIAAQADLLRARPFGYQH